MIKVNIVSSILLAMGVWVGTATAQNLEGTLQKIKDSSTFTLGHLASAPPFSFPGPDKRPVGYSIDLCTHIASSIQKQLGINLKLNWVPVTTANRLDMVASGKVDIECGTSTTTLSRQERVDFSLMTFVDGGGLLTKKDLPLRGVADLADKRIAVIPGTTTETAFGKFLKEEFVSVQTVRVKSHVEGLAAIEQGSADAFASDRGILIGLAVTSKDPSRFALPNILFSYEPYGFMLRRNDAAFRLAVNRALAGLYRSGDIVAVYDRWFGAFGKPSQAIQAMYLLNGLPE
ncbi:MAG TPA: amino acid ABC transporter substrate-binding protein [Candidatus Limnocylindria bacterium]|nr:amino acid ABC transporter substrate-binding protein [Candidatus Limnocylindria bacterium]